MSYFRIGCCIPGGSFMPEGVKEVDTSAYGVLKNGYNAVIQAGFDFAEATVGLIMQLTDDDIKRAADEGLRFQVFNSFIPPSLAIATTPLAELESYVDKAMGRMKALGAECVVFGSGGARRDAGDKVYDFIRMCNSLANKHAMYIALEPLNKGETNWLHTVKDGFDICCKLDLPNLKCLADAYHMFKEEEPATILIEVAKYLTHVHVSDGDRGYPGRDGGEYLRQFSAELKKSGYTGRVSAECGFKDFIKESVLVCEFMKEVF